MDSKAAPVVFEAQGYFRGSSGTLPAGGVDGTADIGISAGVRGRGGGTRGGWEGVRGRGTRVLVPGYEAKPCYYDVTNPATMTSLTPLL